MEANNDKSEYQFNSEKEMDELTDDILMAKEENSLVFFLGAGVSMS